MSKPRRRFLVTPLDAEPPQVPENARVVSADDIETLVKAQNIKEVAEQLVSRTISFGDFKRLLRSKP